MQRLGGSLQCHECFGASQAVGKDALDAPEMPEQPGIAPGVGAEPGWVVRDPPRCIPWTKKEIILSLRHCFSSKAPVPLQGLVAEP